MGCANKVKWAKISMIAVLLLSLISLSGMISAQVEEKIPREETFTYTMSGGSSPSYNPVQFWSMEEYSMDRGGSLVYEWLGYWDQLSGQIEPLLAQSWEWVDDYTFMIYLRKEPYFRLDSPYGGPVTSRDVVFSLRTLGNETFAGPLVTAFKSYVESIEAVDEHTVRVKIAQGYSHDIRVDSILLYPIFSEKRWSKLITEKGEKILEYLNDDPKEMEASGPYTLYYVSPTRTIWIRVDDWWGNKIGWSCVPKYFVDEHLESYEAEARLFRNGETDCLHDTVEGEYEFITQNKDRFGAWDVDAPDWGSMGAVGAAGGVILALNMKIPVFRQQWFRYALAYAIDYDKVASVNAFKVWGSTSLIHSRFPLYEQYVNNSVITENFDTESRAGLLHIKYDSQKAVEILKEHCEGSVEQGWSWQGQRIGPYTINIVAGWTDTELDFSVVAKCLRDIGIDVALGGYTYGAWASKLESGDFEMSYTERIGIGPFEPFDSWYNCFVGGTDAWSLSPSDYQKYWNGSYPECGDTAKEVEDLIIEAYRYPIGSPESIEISKKIQSIVVPQLTFVPLNRHYSFVGKHCLDVWVNWPTKDDPYQHQESINTFFTKIINVKSAKIETISCSVSPGIVEVGNSAIVSVTLKNTGEYDHLHQVDVRNGPARPWPDSPELLAFNITTVPAGETKIVKMNVAFDEPGSYILTVDNWRIGKYDPGEPFQIPLIVTSPTTGYTVEDAMKAAQDAKVAAEAAKTTAQEALTAAQDAKTAAEAARMAAEAAAPVWMVWVAMIITIVVVLGGVYALTKRKG